ncbi:MAG: hypothetical protein NC433_04355 [Clostridiales bacterium]|nr:hypothetical protein [Clostridiales bacterium]
MKFKSMVVIAAIALMTAATGCGGQEPEWKVNYEVPVEEIVDEIEHDSNSPEISSKDVDNLNTNNSNIDNTTNDNELIPEADSSGSKKYIGGKVRSIGQESFVISRTLIDSEGYVTMPEAGSPNEQLVTIKCMDSTVFEHWTIQGGGEGIVTREASFSEITEGGGLEAEGYFEGEEFIANKVIIEVYQ